MQREGDFRHHYIAYSDAQRRLRQSVQQNLSHSTIRRGSGALAHQVGYDDVVNKLNVSVRVACHSLAIHVDMRNVTIIAKENKFLQSIPDRVRVI